MKKKFTLLLSLMMIFLAACSSDTTSSNSSDSSLIRSTEQSQEDAKEVSSDVSNSNETSDTSDIIEEKLATATMEQGTQKGSMELFGDENLDLVTRIEQTITVTNLTDEQKFSLDSSIKDYKEKYEKIDGTSYDANISGDILTEKLILNVGNQETLQKLIDEQLLPVSGDTSKGISLESTIKTLEDAGFTVTRNK